MSAAVFHPHPYQERAIKWALQKDHCGLFLPMGAGKTAITLTAITRVLGIDVRQVLVIGPKRVIESTWPAEIEKWSHTRHMTYQVITAQMAKKGEISDADILLISKENAADLLFKNFQPDMIVVDELSTFKNPSSRRFKALKRVKAKRFIGLTGTPSPKSVADLWAQLFLIDHGRRLGKTITEFRSRWMKPGRRSGYVVYEWIARDGAQKEIENLISDVCMSLESTAELPPLQVIDVALKFSDSLRADYKRFAHELVLDEEITASNAGVLCGKLSQFTSGEIFTADKTRVIHDLKIEALKELTDENIIVFYWFRHEKNRIMKAFPQARELKTKKDIEDWNAGKIPVLLVQPASAGHGLNLQQGGRIAVWYSLPGWNLELYEQANARLYRQGQTQACIIYHLMVEDSIDARQLQNLQQKGERQAALLDALRKEIYDA